MRTTITAIYIGTDPLESDRPIPIETGHDGWITPAEYLRRQEERRRRETRLDLLAVFAGILIGIALTLTFVG